MFELNDRVNISPHSKYFHGSKAQLPPNVVGTIVKINDKDSLDEYYIVKWVKEDGEPWSNSYYPHDLVPALNLIHPTIINNPIKK